MSEKRRGKPACSLSLLEVDSSDSLTRIRPYGKVSHVSDLSLQDFEGIVVGMSKHPRLLSGVAECTMCDWSEVLKGIPNNPARVPRKCKRGHYTIVLRRFNAPLYFCLRLKSSHHSDPGLTAYVDASLMKDLPSRLIGMRVSGRGKRGFFEGHFVIVSGDSCSVGLVEEDADGYRKLEDQAIELHSKLYQGAKVGRKNEAEILKLVETLGDIGGEASRVDLARALGCHEKTIDRRIVGMHSVVVLADGSLWNVSKEVPASKYPPAFEAERWKKTRLIVFGHVLYEIIKRVKESESREKPKLE